MKKYTVKPGQRVTIEINRKSEVRSSKYQAQSPKGLLAAARPEDYPARRIRPGGIMFYDLGLAKTGDVLSDIDSQIVKAWTNTGGSGLPYTPPLDDSDYEGRDALVLSNLAQAAPITPEFTEIIPAALTFGDETVYLTAGTSSWSAKGFRATPAQLSRDSISIYFGFGDGKYFDQIVLKGDGANKITSENSYAADPVPYTLKKDDKIYLVPVFCLSFLQEEFDDHLGFFHFVQQLNSFWMFFPRMPILNGTAPDDVDGKTLANARVMRSTQSSFGGSFTNTEQPASAFESASTNSLSISTLTPAGFLVAVIKQGEQTFYVWKN
ncbi:MAG: hypothetical protein JSS81_26840 [Acidobacteria bacterium]|nr:hypothetical protein [Acidobacteriota bacterium]